MKRRDGTRERGGGEERKSGKGRNMTREEKGRGGTEEGEEEKRGRKRNMTREGRSCIVHLACDEMLHLPLKVNNNKNSRSSSSSRSGEVPGLVSSLILLTGKQKHSARKMSL